MHMEVALDNKLDIITVNIMCQSQHSSDIVSEYIHEKFGFKLYLCVKCVISIGLHKPLNVYILSIVV